MPNRLFRTLLVCTLLTAALIPGRTHSAQAGAEQTRLPLTHPSSLLNPDGTLHLDGTQHGSLDLDGYQVRLDPQQGPVFTSGSSTHLPANGGHRWSTLGENGVAVDDTVQGIAVTGTVAYIVGDFTNVANNPAADFVAQWDAISQTWSALGSSSTGDGSIYPYARSVAVYGNYVYVGGFFTQVGNGSGSVTAASRIARWDGTQWSALGDNGSGGPALNNEVTTVALDSDGNVYAGGSFTNVNNHGTPLDAADYIARWDPQSNAWSALGNGSGGTGALNNVVNALVFSGTVLYAGGSFTDVSDNGTPLPAADRVAQWDGSHWSALGSNGANNGSVAGTVYALAADSSGLYVGGQFVNVNDNGTSLPAADYLTRWDGSHWAALGSNGVGDGAITSTVSALLLVGPALYVGGSFQNINANGTPLPAADFVAQWNTQTQGWSALGDDGAGNGAIPTKGYPRVASLGWLNGKLITGGGFYDVNNHGAVQTQADFLAGWNGTDWSPWSQAVNGALVNGYPSSQVDAIVISGTSVYVAGRFDNVANHGVNLPEADNIARWDSLTGDWSALGSDGAGDGALAGWVYAMVLSGTDIYVGGNFSNAAKLPAADYIARWDGTHWLALGSNGAGNGSLPSGAVTALAVSPVGLYVGGDFVNVNNNGTPLPEADRIALWTGSAWQALGSNGAGNGSITNGSVQALAASGTDLYVGGFFTDTNDSGTSLPAADDIVRWDGAHWSALGGTNTGDGSLNSGVSAIAVSGTVVYAGGSFTDVQDGSTVLFPADYIARWDGTHWSALGSNGVGGNGALNSAVREIVIADSQVYVGGQFANVNDSGLLLTAADHLARWDGTHWFAISNDGIGNGSISGNRDAVNALVVDGINLLVGGEFSNVNSLGTLLPAADYVAVVGIAPYALELPLIRRAP